MNANAHAEVAPNNSNTIPRSQVRRESVRAETTSEVVKMRWRFGWYGSSGNQ